MKDRDKAKLWRGYEDRGVSFGAVRWICKHCSAVVEDPELHTRFHKDLLECLKISVLV